MLTIGDTWGFSGIASITLSRGFSVETLTRVCHKLHSTCISATSGPIFTK